MAVTLDAAARAYRVQPGGSIQEALDAAAKDPANKTVYVHAGTYRPAAHGQALIWFNARHDGITLEAVGEVMLTAANPAIADNKAPSFPAVVNHVVYFGDGVSRKTVLRGFQHHRREQLHHRLRRAARQSNPMTCARRRSSISTAAASRSTRAPIRPSSTSRWSGNYTSPCGAGVSVEHLGRPHDAALFRDCIFRDNRTQITGAAFDLLHGSRATLDNCLFVGNVANLGVDYVGLLTGGEYHPEHGSGAMTVFEGSRAEVSRCTFTGNWAGVDDNGTGSTYVKSIFWNNTLKGGISTGARYEIDITRRRRRTGVVHPRRDERPAGDDRSSGEHL